MMCLNWRWLIFFCALVSLSFGQVKNSGMAQPKTVLVVDSQLVARPDSLKSLFGTVDSLKLKLVFKNDHRWNNWALDTTLSAFNDSTLSQLLKKNRPFKLTYRYIPLRNSTLTPKEKVKKYLKPGLATVGLLCNWTAFYFKRLADDYYDRYKYTSDIHKMNAYYQKTRQFDQLSNALLAVSVVSLSVYLYCLLVD